MFKFNATSEIYSDTINDFAKGDKIDLAGMDANVKLTGNQAFSFINSQGFSGKAGELRYQVAGWEPTAGVSWDSSLMGDVDGDGRDDFYIGLPNYYAAFSVADFLL